MEFSWGDTGTIMTSEHLHFNIYCYGTGQKALKTADTLLSPNCLGRDVLKCRNETPASPDLLLLSPFQAVRSALPNSMLLPLDPSTLPSRLLLSSGRMWLLHRMCPQARRALQLSSYEEGDDDNCEVNGKIYRDGEVFQPSCKLQCRCSGGGFTCIPLCKEDVRLPTPDCPYPKRVEISGKCCPEWICESQERQNLPDAMAAQRLPAITSVAAPYPCDEWSTAWSACSSSCGIGISTRVSNQNPYCRLETQRRFCILGPCQGLMGRTSMRRRGSRL
ncbi:WNT1-inducible-signaling pathway protein 2 [Varanus komodoensis]|nr:WNT1-inducible-signaling pathway protein 2 [Varanus komodoensis]